MMVLALGFLLGDMAGLHLPVLPPWWLGLILFLPIIVLIKLHRYWAIRYFLIGLLAGFVWLTLYGHWQMQWQLPKDWIGKDITLTGTIASIPQQDQQGDKQQRRRFLFKGENIHGLLQLSWYGKSPPLYVGERWQLTVKLKPPHSLGNPGGFDYSAYLLQHHIRATGYVRNKKINKRIAKAGYHYWLDQVRAKIARVTDNAIGVDPLSPMIKALTVGLRQGMTPEQWQVLRATGTSHLMAISGLHISLIAGFAYWLMAFIWRRLGPLPELLATPKAAAIAALVAALIYSALAGFALPTQRALIMITVLLGAQLTLRQLPLWHGLCLALFAVLVVDPFAPLSASFWLSFAAVALLIYGMTGRLQTQGLWWQWGRAQWVIALGFLPVSFYFFQQASIVSPLANIIAIPWVGFIVVPLSLLGSLIALVWPWLGYGLLWLAVKALGLIWWYLSWLGALPHSSIHLGIPNYWVLLSVCVGALLLLAPRGMPGRYLGIIFLLPLVLVKPPRPNHGEFWFTLLSVGQGLATVVQTEHHTLIYDTGPGFSLTNNSGTNVLLPYFYRAGIRHIDSLVISHSDNDHVGGAAAVLAAMPIQDFYSGNPLVLNHRRALQCHQGQHWQWDGVDFQFLYPESNLQFKKPNDQSCVLKITTGKSSLLLTGDIERPSEIYLVKHTGRQLKATVLVAPHHGSKTSSTTAFIAKVHPQYVLYPTGFLNRFHFPNTIVQLRYQQAGVQSFDTAKDGAVFIAFNTHGIIDGPWGWLDRNKHFYQ